jgi:hypothetical protein
MSQTNFYGQIYSGDVAVVRELLQAWLDVDRLDEKLKLSGAQLVYDGAQRYVYAYEASASGGPPYFLLEGHQRAGLDETHQQLQALLMRCSARGVNAVIEYVAVDDTGDEISDQRTVRAP